MPLVLPPCPHQPGACFRGMDWEGKDDDEIVSFSFISVDPDFVETVNLEVIEGRDFSRDFAADTARFHDQRAGQKIPGV